LGRNSALDPEFVTFLVEGCDLARIRFMEKPKLTGIPCSSFRVTRFRPERQELRVVVRVGLVIAERSEMARCAFTTDLSREKPTH
jgi:hypothetical protein